MRATSERQFQATTDGRVAPLEEVRAGVWALPLAMPHPALPFVLSYLVVASDGGVHVIDPGWATDENWEAVGAALTAIGSSMQRVETVTVTHLHPDHIGLAERYRAASGARIALSRVDQAALTATAAMTAATAETTTGDGGGGAGDAGDAALVADALLDDGDVLPIAGRTLRVIATPGHTRGSICLIDEDARLLFTGDTVLPNQFPGLGLGGPTFAGDEVGNPITEYIASLQKLAQYDDVEVLPGHGWRFAGLGERLVETAEHHERRTREAALVMAEHPEATVQEVAERLTWSAGWENLSGMHLRSALAQTAMHLERIRESTD